MEKALVVEEGRPWLDKSLKQCTWEPVFPKSFLGPYVAPHIDAIICPIPWPCIILPMPICMKTMPTTAMTVNKPMMARITVITLTIED